MSLTHREREYLASQILGRLATLGPDGTLQNSPVGFRYNTDTDTIDIGGRNMGATKKFRNVRANGAVAFVVDDLASRDPWTVRGVELRGRAEALTTERAPGPGMSAEIIRIHPQRVIAWGIDPDHEGMHARTVDA